MDQNSGDVSEPNTGGSQQCSKEKYATDEICGAGPRPPSPVPGSPSASNKAVTVFNLGAAPFISAGSNGIKATPPSKSSAGDSAELFPWNGAILTASTPLIGAKQKTLAADTPLAADNGPVAGSVPPIKDIMELNNRLNSMCGLGLASHSSNNKQSLTPPPALQKAKSIPLLTAAPTSTASIPLRGSGNPMPNNILRHLNNNNIMGNLLQETNPPPPGILGPRSASEYRAYFNSNLINGNSELNCLPSVPQSIVAAAGSQNGSYLQRPLLNGGHVASAGSNPGGPVYNYRFDLENNRQRNSMASTAAGPPTGPHQSQSIGANPGNQFHHVRPGTGNIGLPANLYGENHFLVTHANGIIQLKLKDGIEIEMTLDGAIRVVNWRCNVSIALASSSNSAALIHPNGRVLQYHSRVEIMTYDGKNKNNFVRFAKIWYKGISFTSENNALVYLVDSGGTRTTTDTFMDLRNDITEQVFLTGSTHGPAYDNQAKKEVMNHKYWPALDGTEVHELNGFRIAQTVDGMVRITKTNKNILVRTSPGNGSATLTTAYIHCTASLGQTSHLFVRRGERRMHFDGAEFVVRNSGHSAGFDSNNLLRALVEALDRF